MPTNARNVSEITRDLIQIVQDNSNLQNVWIQGEISKIKPIRNGPLNFTLTDEGEKIECVIFDNGASFRENLPSEGSSVFVKGQIFVYGIRSEYRFKITDINLSSDSLPSQPVSVAALTNTLKATIAAHSSKVQGEISEFFVTDADFTILKLKNATAARQPEDIIECVIPPGIIPPFPLQKGEKVNVKGQFGIFAIASAYRIEIGDANNITQVTGLPIPGLPALNECRRCQLLFNNLQDNLCATCYDARLTSEGIVVGAVDRFFTKFIGFSTEPEWTIHFSDNRKGRADVVLRRENEETLAAIAECKKIEYDGNDGILQLHAYLSASGTGLGLFAADTDPYEWTFIKNLGRGNFDEITRSQFERELGVEQTPGIPPDKTRLELIHGNIIEAEVDAIVTTASAQLIRVPGVDGEIWDVGGEEIERVCREIIEQRRSFLSIGDAAITTGGNLPTRHIIHAVGPTYREGNATEMLTRCYENSLKVAVENGIQSIAFPAISTGNFGFPIEQATPIALNAVKEFVEHAHQNNDMVPERIQFVLFDEEAYNCYVKEFSNLGFGLSCLIG